MILRCLPSEVLASDIAEFEANGTAATEIGLPMNMILGQLPSGKVEMTLQELIPHFPAGYLQPTESLENYLNTTISLPLMDVVMRIPPDLLALRPDQKDVDASVINMADPFTEEILREQAEAARRQSTPNATPNIIEESQAPQEEFVPRDQAAASKVIPSTIAPPRRPTVDPLSPSRTAATTLAAPPMPAVAKLPTPSSPPGPRASQLLSSATTTAPVRSFATPSPIPVPERTSGPLPTVPLNPMPGAIPPPPPLPVTSTAPVPPVPRHTGPIPAPPPPRHTTSLPVPRRTGSVPTIAAASALASTPASDAPVSAETTAEKVAAHAPDAGADDLQRLAALAMAQLGETEGEDSLISTPASAETPVAKEPEAPAAPAPEREAVSVPEPVAVAAPALTPPSSLRTSFIPPAAPVAPPAPTPEPAPAPEPPAAEKPVEKPAEEPKPAVESKPAAEPDAPSSAVAFNINTCSSDDLVSNISGCSKTLADAVIQHRAKIGSYKRLEELLDVPGMTKAAYVNLTGEQPPANRVVQSINELLLFPATQTVTLKDVTDRISCWPDVTGCLLSQSSGLSLVGSAPEGLDKEAIVAFAPRMFESVNKSFAEVSGETTDALLIPSNGTSYHLFRNGDLYLIILSRLPQMPERHMKVARLVLAALNRPA